MTLAVFLTLASMVISMGEIIFFRAMRNSGRMAEGAFYLLVLASAALPVLIYVILAVFLPDIGSKTVF